MRPGTNAIEACKALKDGDGLRIREDLASLIEKGHESLTTAEKDLLKWVGVFFRKPTPGRFMMRVRMPNGFTNSSQLRAIADLSLRLGNCVLDITTRQISPGERAGNLGKAARGGSALTADRDGQRPQY